MADIMDGLILELYEARQRIAELEAALDGSKGSPGYYFANDARDWAVAKWRSEVEHRPMNNIYRAILDTTWRQVIRHFGGDDELLCGPRHVELVDVLAKGGTG